MLNEEVARYAFVTQCLYSCLDSLNICQFVFGAGWQLYDPAQLVEAVCSITGWNVSMEELLKAGEKRINLMRIFNLQAGIDISADLLPKKIFQPLAGGKSDGRSINPVEFEQARRAYYQLAGWDVETGIPGQAKLETLGIGWAREPNGTARQEI